MAREIKFRGQKKDGRWIIMPCTLHCKQSDECLLVGYQPKQFRYCFVKPETVGQFTGLYDKNGKEIYEGDILKFHDKEVYAKVFWNEKVAAFFADTYAVDSHGVSFVTGINTVGRIAESKEYEIVGNIHDNPTLLKGGENE